MINVYLKIVELQKARGVIKLHVTEQSVMFTGGVSWSLSFSKISVAYRLTRGAHMALIFKQILRLYVLNLLVAF